MTKPLSWGGRFAALLLLPCGILPLVIAPRTSAPIAAPAFHDWTSHHIIYPQYGTSRALDAARIDPRAPMRWRETEQRQLAQRQINIFAAQRLLQFRYRGGPPVQRFPQRRPPVNMQRDWSINLGTAGTAISMYPAKFSFNTTATPSCSADFVVFPVNTGGTTTQPNLVAFNNLYSGTTGGTGKCNRTVSGNDTGTAATVMWSYNIQALGGGVGAVPASPVLSLDGNKVAFVESATGQPAHFHVLAWKNGDGKDTKLQNTLKPVTLKAPFSTTAPANGSGQVTDLVLGTSSSTLSSPFIDYSNDNAYVGNDAGVVYRIKNIFCTTAACIASNSQPALDSTWGSGGALTIGGTCAGTSGRLTAPVLNFPTYTLFVGCADGRLYAISSAGTVTSIVVGDGVGSKAFGGIVDPPVVDPVNDYVYAVSGSAGGGANGVLLQAPIDLSSSVAVPIGSGNQCNIHSPTPNNAYFTSPTTAGALMYVAGTLGTVGPCTATGATGGTGEIFGVTFTATGKLTAGAPAKATSGLANPGNEFAPILEFFNPNIGGGEDLLFFAVLCTGANMASYNVTSGFPTTTGFLSGPITEGFGTSGFVVDNSALTSAGNTPQAASIYFNALGENATCTGNTGGNTTPGTGGCAIKLTQAGLQ
jgi:hypothetical protein